MSIILNNKLQKNVFILALAVLALTLPVAAKAQTPAATPCDPKYYDSLESRAWLEAQREITQNQNLIFKPDSVLEYTCFDSFLNHLTDTEANAPLFSSGKGWSSATTKADMAGTLENLVGAAIKAYLEGNFKYEIPVGGTPDFYMLGGQLTSVVYAPATPVSAAVYACSMMKDVWQTAEKTAKCRDFIQDPANDGFFTFAEYQADPDKRHLPAQCGGIPDRWKQEIEIATNAVLSGGTTTTWPEDKVVTYLDRLDPANCGKPENPPITTGIMVQRNETPDKYVERVCITPGCLYTPPANPTAPKFDEPGTCAP